MVIGLGELISKTVEQIRKNKNSLFTNGIIMTILNFVITIVIFALPFILIVATMFRYIISIDNFADVIYYISGGPLIAMLTDGSGPITTGLVLGVILYSVFLFLTLPMSFAVADSSFPGGQGFVTSWKKALTKANFKILVKTVYLPSLVLTVLYFILIIYLMVINSPLVIALFFPGIFILSGVLMYITCKYSIAMLVNPDVATGLKQLKPVATNGQIFIAYFKLSFVTFIILVVFSFIMRIPYLGSIINYLVQPIIVGGLTQAMMLMLKEKVPVANSNEHVIEETVQLSAFEA